MLHETTYRNEYIWRKNMRQLNNLTIRGAAR